MPDTPSLKLPYPTLDDVPDVPRDIKALADALDKLLVFPSITRKRTDHLAMPMSSWAALSMQSTVASETVNDGEHYSVTPSEVTLLKSGVYAVTGDIWTNSTDGAALMIASNSGAASIIYGYVRAGLGTGSISGIFRLGANTRIGLHVYGYGPAGQHSCAGSFRVIRLGS